MDPFFAQPTMAIFCDILEPGSGEPYEPRPAHDGQEGRSLHEVQPASATPSCFGPEAEFFIFDDVRFKADPYNTGFRSRLDELPDNTDTEYEMGNLGHRPRTKGGYFPVPPVDSLPGHPLRNARP
jgi:glutamine synthetase